MSLYLGISIVGIGSAIVFLWLSTQVSEKNKLAKWAFFIFGCLFLPFALYALNAILYAESAIAYTLLSPFILSGAIIIIALLIFYLFSTFYLWYRETKVEKKLEENIKKLRNT